MEGKINKNVFLLLPFKPLLMDIIMTSTIVLNRWWVFILSPRNKTHKWLILLRLQARQPMQEGVYLK